MLDSPVSIKSVLKIMFLSFLIITLYLIHGFLDPRTKVVFCNVGQGDGAYIRVKNKIDIVIDAGPYRKILSCLGRYMPFYDHSIELAILSHPQKDHYGGYLYLLDRYQIKKFLTVNINNTAQSFQRLKTKLSEKHIPILFPKSGDRIIVLNDAIEFLWPTTDFLAQNIRLPNISKDLKRTETNSNPSNILGTSTLDLNHFSLIFQFRENTYKILFTGDASPMILNKLSQQYKNSLDHPIKTTILKIPHHGSRNGLTAEFLKLANPQVSVISVGKNNPFGHPHKTILEMLQASGTKIRRTDKEGDIVFKFKTKN